MNKIFKFFSLLSIVAMLISSCTPEEFSLADKNVKSEDLVEGIAYKIEHDASNPNIVYLKSLMGGQYTPLWSHPQGRSQEANLTLKMPFAGTYDVVFGVETRGGVVWGDTVTFTIDNMYPDFISNPLWSKLAGGPNKEKTWYVDLDAEAVSRYFLGPLYFYGTADSWETVTEGKKVTGDSWNWNPDYKGNSWLMTAANFGSMTFDLKGGAHITVEHKTIAARGTEKGIYMIDPDNHTMRTQGATILHDTNRDGVVVDWSDIKIMSLTDSTMQLAVLRDPILSGEGACLLVYNFISKEYKDDWVPGEVVEPEPTLPENWKNTISQTVSTSNSIKWALSPTTPFNWANLDGTLKNEKWVSPETYDGWTGFTAASAANFAGFSFTLNSTDNSATYVAPDGTSTKGTFTLNEKGIYTFKDITPDFEICGGWVKLQTTAENQWRITNIEKDASGNVTGMWVGKRDVEKLEYMVYHLIPQTGGSGSDPLAAWKKALIGKTFKPDVNWFVDWINFDLSGGWTSATTFGTDYTSNGWVWNEATKIIAESASIKFEASGNDIKATLTQDLKDINGALVTAGYTVTGKVVIDPSVPSLKFEFPLVDYTGSAGSWLNKDNAKGHYWIDPVATKEWIFVSHKGSDLSTIDTNGFWLGCVGQSIAAGDAKDEILVFHYVIAQ